MPRLPAAERGLGPATPSTVRIASRETVPALSEAREACDSCVSPGSLPLGAACSISASISPPIRMKRPVTYIQVSSMTTAPMLPSVVL
jgi:hypothetical protein